MDDETARIGTQKLVHETPKKELESQAEESRKESTADVFTQSIDREKSTIEKSDVETAIVEEKDPDPVKVPRSQRRGLFARFTTVAEVDDPKLYPRRTKWFITFVVGLAALAAPLGSAIIFRKSQEGICAHDPFAYQ